MALLGFLQFLLLGGVTLLLLQCLALPLMSRLQLGLLPLVLPILRLSAAVASRRWSRPGQLAGVHGSTRFVNHAGTTGGAVGG